MPVGFILGIGQNFFRQGGKRITDDAHVIARHCMRNIFRQFLIPRDGILPHGLAIGEAYRLNWVNLTSARTKPSALLTSSVHSSFTSRASSASPERAPVVCTREPPPVPKKNSPTLNCHPQAPQWFGDRRRSRLFLHQFVFKRVGLRRLLVIVIDGGE